MLDIIKKHGKEIALGESSLRLLLDKSSEGIKIIESLFNVEVFVRGDLLSIEGADDDVNNALKVVEQIDFFIKKGCELKRDDLRHILRECSKDENLEVKDYLNKRLEIKAGRKIVSPKGLNQINYLNAISKNDLTFAIGPAGTGKTFLAVTMAVNYLLEKRVSRIILTRPAVEAGEKLGFLPGDMQEKVNPYLRPLYDALYHLLDFERVQKFLEKEIIEIAPLAFMRGRTLSESFIILDEAQNTTSEQMKMFLTRIGLNSKVVVTGDITQIDLPSGKRSGLVEAVKILKDVKGISFCYFDEGDVVRHSLVQLIINAYKKYEEGQGNGE